MLIESKTSETPKDRRQVISIKCAFLELANDVMKRSICAGRISMMLPSEIKRTPYVATMISSSWRKSCS